MNICDIANAISPAAKQKIVGIRPGEKLHEQMIGIEDAPYTYEYPSHYKILPSINEWSTDPERIKDGKKVDQDFSYSSDTNPEWMDIKTLETWLEENQKKIGKF
jgi:FlaA1/EpsC-like NDP-sugar epimerase